MLVYEYDKVTKEYIGTNEAYLDKVATRRLQKEVYALPIYCTEQEPPKVKKGEVAVFKNNQWVIEKDYRGQTVYNLDTRQGQIWTQIGNLPRGYVTNLPERLEDVKTLYLKMMKTNFDVCLTTTKIQIPTLNLYFTYNSLERLKNEQATGIQMSRDDNNKIYMLTRQEYDAIINYLVIYGQFMYLQKWNIENTLKKCTDLEILKSHLSDIEFKVDINQINSLVKLTPDKRKEYFMRMANNIK